MIQCSVVRCFLTDQAGLRKLGERLLESEVGRISLSENKIGNLCVGKRKIHLLSMYRMISLYRVNVSDMVYTSFLKSTTGFSLPDILFFEHLSHLIEHQPLVTGPERSHKKGLGAVTGQTVDDNVGRSAHRQCPEKSRYSSMDGSGKGYL